MTTMTLFKYFIRKYTGGNFKKLYMTPMTFVIAACGIYSAEVNLAIAPFVLYLMTSCFMVSIMFLSLSSTENAADLKNLFMMPLDRKAFLISHVSSIGITAFLMRAFAIIALCIAVSRPEAYVIACMLLCDLNALLVSVCAFAFRKRPYVGILWFAAGIAVMYFLQDAPYFLPVLLGNAVLCILALSFADKYAFFVEEASSARTMKSHHRHSVIRYLARYLLLHKNYLVNSGIMIVCACIFPPYFKQFGMDFAYPLGFAVVLVNTPLGILLSCSPATEQTVHTLPGQKRTFCVPYCMFLFFSNMIPTMLYAAVSCILCDCSPAIMFPAALFFSMQGAILSVILEWFFPIRGWKQETDLWHHPRKYVMPASMAIVAGLVATFPIVVYGLLLFLAAEIIVLLVMIRK